jgi:hypothetical protein
MNLLLILITYNVHVFNLIYVYLNVNLSASLYFFLPFIIAFAMCPQN